MNLSNRITAGRLFAGPLLLGVAAARWRWLFVALLAVALASDALDGWLARRRDEVTTLGARLDSWADLGVTLSGILGGVWLFWDVVRPEAVWVGLYLGSWLLPTVMSVAKYGRTPSYHSRLAKLTAILAAPGALLLLGGWPWLFRIAACAGVVEAAEEVAMTALLPTWQANVAGLRLALALRREQTGAPTGRAAGERAAGRRGPGE